ncbi:DUF6325 family protein [Acetobacterium wieringae]|uniref:DUF6325 family protein n=1 Tax=Acetobacterium wieringae TaxID=52694 RepID=UPI002B21DBFD|nr:DUF6325 family protein [Acetobacterium wieringae]MEA4805535.1 DUF6325 family protein [Acetobacterium wieringae]
MRGPIDYIVLEFEGNQFKGEVLNALTDAVSKKIINVLDLAVILKDENGNVVSLELNNLDGELAQSIAALHREKVGLISIEDTEEVGEVLAPNNAAGLLIIEQLWAKDLKRALINANGKLVSEGRIHPDAAAELDEEEEN